MTDSISTRCAKLNQVFAGKNVGRKSSGASFTREAFLDAFLLLFEECNSEFMLKDKNISAFVKKCKYYKSSCAFVSSVIIEIYSLLPDLESLYFEATRCLQISTCM